jgi:Uma2 family endonuclease
LTAILVAKGAETGEKSYGYAAGKVKLGSSHPSAEDTAMVTRFQSPCFSPEEYLDWEERQSIRYEYVDGEVYAMSGGTIPHSGIAVNFIVILKGHLRGRGCQLLNSDAKVRITEQGPFFYPDISVSCDPRDRSALRFIDFPCLIAEVLSPSTEAYNRGSKFAQYRRFDSLQEYVLVSSEAIEVEVFRLNERGKWELTPYVEGDEIHLTSVDLKFSIEQLYEDVTLAPATLEAPLN